MGVYGSGVRFPGALQLLFGVRDCRSACLDAEEQTPVARPWTRRCW
eukprot:SAG25_NODE_11019_length_316_cov_0.714286_1_plen_45_part_10